MEEVKFRFDTTICACCGMKLNPDDGWYNIDGAAWCEKCFDKNEDNKTNLEISDVAKLQEYLKNNRYLGDGVYAGQEPNGHLVLYTSDGVRIMNKIYFDWQVLNALCVYLHLERSNKKVVS